MNKNIIKVGNVSVGNSQAGSVYGSWGGHFQHYALERTVTQWDIF